MNLNNKFKQFNKIKINLLLLTSLSIFSNFNSVIAQEVYKSVDSKGVVTYSNKPDAKNKDKKTKLSPFAIEGVESYNQNPANINQDTPKTNNNKNTNSTTYKEKVIEAESKLAKARKNIEDGATPQEGERIATVNGNKLTEKYFTRQNQLQEELNAAIKEYEELLKNRE